MFSSDAGEGEGTVFNLSYGGCAIRSYAQLQKGSYIQLQVYLPARMTRLVVELAPVRWTTQHAFGLEFITMAPMDQALLQEYISVLKAGTVAAEGYPSGG
jgi:hypothetical protein